MENFTFFLPRSICVIFVKHALRYSNTTQLTSHLASYDARTRNTISRPSRDRPLTTLSAASKIHVVARYYDK